MKTFLSLALSAVFIVGSVAGLTSCQLLKTAEEKRSEEEYANDTKRRVELAQELRRAAAEARTMSVHFDSAIMSEAETELPLTRQEVQKLREIFSEIEATPAPDFTCREKLRSFHATYLLYTFLELKDKEGHLLYNLPLMSGEPIGDAAKAESYRLDPWGPRYMLPSKTYRRWKALPFHRRVEAVRKKLRRRAGL